MRILLPPSETKHRPDSGPTLDLDILAFPTLRDSREEIISTLIDVSDSPDALNRLGVGKTLGAEVAANTGLWTAPTAPAHAVYTGVLYDALSDECTHDLEATDLESVYVSSAAFGLINLADPIPCYRLSMQAGLLGQGNPLATWWRPKLTPVLAEAFASELILDCRSGEYRKAWPGTPATTVTVNVVTQRGGVRKTVSHSAKHTRGQLVGFLLSQTGAQPNTVEELLDACSSAFEVEYAAPTSRRAAVLTVVLRKS